MDLNDIHTEIKIQTKEGSFKNKDGKVIFTRQWQEKGSNPRASIFVSHGFAEHSQRYSDYLAPALVKEGFLVISHDHIGHGKSEGERAQVSTFDIYIQDIFQHVDQVTAKYPSLKIFLFGHSMGGAIAILTAMQRPGFFTGVILSAPAIMADPDLDTNCMRCLGKTFGNIFPSLQVISAIDPAKTCRNPEKVEAYRTDPLVYHGGIKARWGVALTQAMDTINAKMKEIEWPYLIMHGDADALVMVDGSILFEKLTKSTDKTLKVYEGYYHELLNEPRQYSDIVLKDILNWIRKRMPSST